MAAALQWNALLDGAGARTSPAARDGVTMDLVAASDGGDAAGVRAAVLHAQQNITDEAAKQVHAQRNTALLAVRRAGHVDVVKFLLTLDGAWRVTACSGPSSACCFCVACSNGHVDVARLLLRRGRVPVYGHKTHALTLACVKGHTSIVRFLTELGGTNYVNVHVANDAPFIAACRAGHVDIVDLFLSFQGPRRMPFGVPHNAFSDTAMLAACANGHTGVVHSLLRYRGGGRTRVPPEALVHACAGGHLDTVRALLAARGFHYVDLGWDEDSAFCAACANGRADVMRLLLRYRGPRRVDARAQGGAALVGACGSGCVEAVQLLLTLPRTRRVQQVDAARRAARRVVRSDDAAMLRCIVRYDSDVLFSRDVLQGAFEYACAVRSVNVVRTLLDVDGVRRVDPRANEHAGFCSAGDGTDRASLAIMCMLLSQHHTRLPPTDVQDRYWPCTLGALHSCSFLNKRWRSSPILRNVPYLCARLQRSALALARRAVWRHRRRVLAARRA